MSDFSTIDGALAASAPEPRKPFVAKNFNPEANAFDFGDLPPTETVVKYRGEEFVLTEASADAATKYKNASMKAAKMDDAKVVGVDGLADADPLLVSLCLFKLDHKTLVNGAPRRETLAASAVRTKFPHKHLKQMYEWIKYHSDLNEEDETLDALKRRRAELDKKIAREEAKAKAGQEEHPKGE